jgi:hypothetical protein
MLLLILSDVFNLNEQLNIKGFDQSMKETNVKKKKLCSVCIAYNGTSYYSVPTL